ncbi:hypothetical protein [Rufibacter soli]
MADSNFDGVYGLVSSWAEKTDSILERQLAIHKVGITKELLDSIKAKVYRKAGEMIEYDLSFLMRGRFRDMGAGRPRKVESMETNRKMLKTRKPVPIYARPFYGRLNALQGAIGFKISEQAIAAVISNITPNGN